VGEKGGSPKEGLGGNSLREMETTSCWCSVRMEEQLLPPLRSPC